MKQSEKSVIYFDVYMLVVAAFLLFIPATFTSWVGFPPPGDPLWVRVCGIFMVIFAYLGICSCRRGLREFLVWTIHGRLFASAFFTPRSSSCASVTRSYVA